MILAIDTASSAASACLLVPGEVVPISAEMLPMQGGQAEALMPLLDRVIARAPRGFASLTRVAVTVGPGSFTGIRIGVAAARAIALARRIPAVGVSTLSALVAPALSAGLRPPLVAAIDARHGNVFVQGFGGRGETLFGPGVMRAVDAARAVGPGPVRLIGSGAALVAAAAAALGISTDVDAGPGTPDIAFVARLGLLADPAQALPKPLYLKAPDAKPPAGSRLLESA